MTSLTLYYNGTLEDLKTEVDKVDKMFNRFSIYRSSTHDIKRDIYPDFDKYKDYRNIYINSINILNTNATGFLLYIHPSFNSTVKNPPLYNWVYTEILLLIMLILFIFFLFIVIYCYICNIDIYLYLGYNFSFSS